MHSSAILWNSNFFVVQFYEVPWDSITLRENLVGFPRISAHGRNERLLLHNLKIPSIPKCNVEFTNVFFTTISFILLVSQFVLLTV